MARRTRRGRFALALWAAALAAALATSSASPSAVVTVTKLATLDALLQEGSLVIALFYKSYCPWCAEFMVGQNFHRPPLILVPLLTNTIHAPHRRLPSAPGH